MSRDPGKVEHADKELSQLYQSLRAPVPDITTDEAILHFAKQRTLVKQVPERKPRINWTGGVSVAASILGVSVLYWTQFAPSDYVASKPGQEEVIAAELSKDLALSVPAEVKHQIAGTGHIVSDLENPNISARMNGERKLTKRVFVEQNSVSAETIDSQMKSHKESLIEIANADMTSGDTSNANTKSTNTDKVERIVAQSKLLENVLPDNEKSAPDMVASMQRRLKSVVSVTTKCPVSVDGGYSLSNTPLAEYITTWNRADKIWLTEQLNRFTPLETVIATYQRDKTKQLQTKGFATAYGQTIDSLKNCKTLYDPER